MIRGRENEREKKRKKDGKGKMREGKKRGKETHRKKVA